MIVFEKFGQHQPLNRQAERYALEGAPIALSTLADAVGAVATALDPLGAWSRPTSWRPSACTPTTVCCGSTQKDDLHGLKVCELKLRER